MTTLDRDDFDRTALLALHNGSQPTLEAALAARSRFGIRLACPQHTDVAGTSATLTAVTAAVRVAGVVLVALPDPETVLPVGPARGSSLRDAISAAGGHLADGAPIEAAAVQQWVELRLGGAGEVYPDSAAAVLHAHWDGWTAHVSPAAPNQVRSGNVLAAIAAAALAVHEAFGIFNNRPGRDDGYRDIHLDLWSSIPGTAPQLAPHLAWAPIRWWLIGLGHLGQANAWVLAWLLAGHPAAEIVLQDDAVISAANRSTGVFATSVDVGLRKTRLTAAHLERAGLATRVIEQRFDANAPVPAAQQRHVALFGVDNLDVRRSISRSSFELSLDAGLGTGPGTFDSILIHRFPGGVDSDQIPSWRPEPSPIAIPDTPAFAALRQQHDICGVTELAGTAVGAAFVGLTAAVLTVTEALRASHGGASLSLLRVDLATVQPAGAPARRSVEPPAERLPQARSLLDVDLVPVKEGPERRSG